MMPMLCLETACAREGARPGRRLRRALGQRGAEMNELTSALPGPVHAFDAPAAGAPAPAAPAPLAGRPGSGTRPGPKLPRSDVGTVILHWTVAASVLASLLTGLRIAADDTDRQSSVEVPGADPAAGRGLDGALHRRA